MHFGKGVGDVTHREWVAYFQYALDYHSSDYGDLVEKIKTSVIMDENDLDVDRCFDKWVFAYWRLLERNHMMSFHLKHPKIAVEALTHGLRPAPLRRLIQTHLKLDKIHLRHSVLQFFDFVKSKLVFRLELVRAGNPAGLVRTTDISVAPPAGNPKKQQGFKPKLASPAATPKFPAAKLQTGKMVGGTSVRTPICWGCGGAHSLRDCSVTAESDKKGIADKRVAAWRDKDRERGTPSKSFALHAPSLPHKTVGVPPGAGYCEAIIPGTPLPVPLYALLDSGGESAGIISRGLYELLVQSSPADWSLQVLKHHQVWEGFGKVPVLMNRHIIFPVLELFTPAGPYRLLRFTVRIDESDPDTNLTVGLPVMREMGYTTMGLIQSAQVVSSTLDLRHLSVTDQGDTSAVHRLRTLRKQTEEREFEGVEDMDDDDDDGDISPETADMAVTEALKAAVASADAEGISPEGKSQLGRLGFMMSSGNIGRPGMSPYRWHP